jgi:UDP-glucose 4-epimerase
MASKKILVTGGAGFIGSHTVVELAQSGYEPVIMDDFSNSQASVLEGLERILGFRPVFYEADCNDATAFRKIFKEEKDMSGVIHFAAFKAVGESVQQPLKYYRNNVVSLLSLLETARDFAIPNIVFSSSCTVYGEPSSLPVDESFPILPAQSPYGNTKQVCEEILRDAVASGLNFKVLSLRYFNPIGAHPGAEIGELPIGVPGNLVPFVVQTAAGWRKELSVFGDDYQTPDGTCIRDYIHVVDIAKAHVKAIEYLQNRPESRLYDWVNLGTGTGSSVMEVVKAFEKVSGMKLNYRMAARRSGDVEKIFASTEKASRLLNWQTEKSLEEALADAWRWQQKLPDSSLSQQGS